MDEMLQELRELKRSARHINGLRNSLTPFVREFPRLWRVKDVHITGYLRGLGTRVGERRCENILAAVVQLSLFAKRRGYLPEERLSAVEKVRRNQRRRWITDAKPIATWTISEARLLIDGVSKLSPKWLPATALGLFAGLRTSEIFRLDWGAVKFDQRLIAISGRVARKTRLSRLIPISDNLLAWLQPFRECVGPIYAGNFKTSENTRSLDLARVRLAVCLPRKDNANRHSFGSYRLALIKSYEEVAREMGNGPKIVRENYNDPKPESDGIAYFQIAPPNFDKVIPLPKSSERTIKPLTSEPGAL